MAQKTRKVCYIVFDENTNCCELYLNEQVYDEKYEWWENIYEKTEKLVMSFPLFKRKGFNDDEENYIHIDLLSEISRLIDIYDYTFLGMF